MFVYFFVLNTCFPYLIYLYVITANNATNNKTIAASLKNLLKGASLSFTKNYLTPCMAHGLNLAVQSGLKEPGNDESYSDSEDDGKHMRK